MKKFLATFFFILISVYILSYFCSAYLNYRQKHNFWLKSSWMINRDYTGCQIVYIGRSLIQAAVNPSIIERTTGLKGINLGHGGLSYCDNYLFSCLYFKNPTFKPKLVVLDVSPISLNMNADFSPGISIKYFLPYVSSCSQIQEALKHENQDLYNLWRVFPLSLWLRTRNIPYIEILISKTLPVRHAYFQYDSIEGALQVPLSFGYNSKPLFDLIKHVKIIDSAEVAVNYFYFIKTIRLFEQHNVRVILTSTPLTNSVIAGNEVSVSKLIPDFRNATAECAYFDFIHDTLSSDILNSLILFISIMKASSIFHNAFRTALKNILTLIGYDPSKPLWMVFAKFGIVGYTNEKWGRIEHFIFKSISMGNKKIITFCFLYSTVIFLVFIHPQDFKNIGPCLETKNRAIDRIEDHMIAVNLALKNKFPFIGFLDADKEYKFCASHQIAPYFNLLKKLGPMVSFYRHPFYPFCMGVLYKIFGVNPLWDIYMVILFYSIIIGFLPLAGFKLSGTKGVAMGIIASLLCLKYYSPFSEAPLQHFAVFWGCVCFFTAISLNKQNYYVHLVFGIVSVAAFLAKGVFILIPVFYFIAISFKFLRHREATYLRLLFPFLIGFIIAYGPWFVYANYLNQKMAVSMRQWRENAVSGLPSWQEMAAKRDLVKNVLEKRDEEIDEEMSDFIFRNLFAVYVTPAKIIITTNQLAGDQFLIAQNELCVDGKWPYFDYMMSTSLYYKKHPSDKSVLMRVLSFYICNPNLFVKVMSGKLVKASEKLPSFFWLAIVLQSIAILQNFIIAKTRNNILNMLFFIFALLFVYSFFYSPFSPLKLSLSLLLLMPTLFIICIAEYRIPAVFMAFSLSGIFIVMLSTGQTRYIEVFKPISVLACVYFAWSITENLFISLPFLFLNNSIGKIN